MKKPLLAFFAAMCFIQVNAQFRNLKYWESKGLINMYSADANKLSAHINYLDSSVLSPFKVAFDTARKVGIQDMVRTALRHLIKTDSNKISCDIDSVKNDIYYGNKEMNSNHKRDTSFLYYYINKELNDYLQSLTSLKQEMGFIFRKSTQNYMDGFDNTNFLNAYYNMAQSRSLLLAAMDNLERFYLLGSEIDSIKDTSIVIKNGVDTAIEHIDSQNRLLIKIDTTTQSTDSVLYKSFKPYTQLSTSRMDTIRSKSTDKISMAANTILMDNRKNWWWRNLLAGIIGGLIAALLVRKN